MVNVLKVSNKMAYSNSAAPDETAPSSLIMSYSVCHSTKCFKKQQHKKQNLSKKKKKKKCMEYSLEILVYIPSPKYTYRFYPAFHYAVAQDTVCSNSPLTHRDIFTFICGQIQQMTN